MKRWAFFLPLLLLVLALSPVGCAPVTFSATFFADNARLHEVPVEQDRAYAGKIALIGIHSRSLVSGANKDVANPLKPERDSHYALLQAMVEEFYQGFRATVVERRGPGHAGADATVIDTSRLDTLTDGRIVTGRQA